LIWGMLSAVLLDISSPTTFWSIINLLISIYKNVNENVRRREGNHTYFNFSRLYWMSEESSEYLVDAMTEPTGVEEV
jgi:hypothetical protein